MLTVTFPSGMAGGRSRFYAIPSNRFKSIHERGDFGLQKFAYFAVLPPDNPGIEMAKALFDSPVSARWPGVMREGVAGILGDSAVIWPSTRAP
jgi:hypothetical protein